MKNFKKISILALTLLLTLSLVLTGCQNTEPNEGQSQEQDGQDQAEEPKEKGKVKLGMVNWAEGVAMTNLVAAVLEDKMGYEAEITTADLGLIFTSLAEGDTDVYVDTWLPLTHEAYMNEFGDDLTDLGVNYEGAKIGLVVPSYVEANSLEELNDYKDDFNGEIVGIGSGAGMMKITEDAIEEYGLDFDLQEGSAAVMTAALADAIENEEPIIVTGWKPHWKFARFDLKFLEDPKGVFGESEIIKNMARKGIEEDMPEVAQFLRNFNMNDQQLGGLMGDIANSEDDTLEVARKWMNENEDLVNSWLPEQ